MQNLLDINVIIALLDAKHFFHEHVHRWWRNEKQIPWASCPIIENGVVRIMSLPSYDSLKRFSVSKVQYLLKSMCDDTDHTFWTDEISLLDERIFDTSQILGPGQLTDIYLLGLANHKRGRLVTLDTGINIRAVKGADPNRLLVLTDPIIG